MSKNMGQELVKVDAEWNKSKCQFAKILHTYLSIQLNL